MIYTFKCSNCGVTEDIAIPLGWLDEAKSKAWCSLCFQPAKQVLHRSGNDFMRSPFRRGFHEHISAEGRYIRDRHEAVDVAAENGLTSVYCENLT